MQLKATAFPTQFAQTTNHAPLESQTKAYNVNIAQYSLKWPLGIQLGTQGCWLPWESNWEYRDAILSHFRAILGP